VARKKPLGEMKLKFGDWRLGFDGVYLDTVFFSQSTARRILGPEHVSIKTLTLRG